MTMIVSDSSAIVINAQVIPNNCAITGNPIATTAG
jgi:hypothetical protein